MTNKSKLWKKSKAYNKLKESTDFEMRYGSERTYGESIMKEQEMRDKIIKLQDRREKLK